MSSQKQPQETHCCVLRKDVVEDVVYHLSGAAFMMTWSGCFFPFFDLVVLGVSPERSIFLS